MPLRHLLTSLRNRRFLFVEPGGNWGDHLIYLGAQHLAQSVNVLSFRTLTWDRYLTHGARDGEIIYLHGGGGFVATSSGRASRILQTAIDSPGATVIQGPCTLADGHALDTVDFDTMRCDRLVFLTREQRSCDLAASLLPSSVEQHLNEDTAFYLTRDVLASRIGRVTPRIDLWAIREDPEAGRPRHADGGWKIILDPARYAQSLDHWIRIHASSRTIRTDRMHSAICGAILGIPVTMFGGAYHKNRSMWEYSLKRRGVQWLDDDTAIPQRSAVDPLLTYLPTPFQQSWKLDRWAKSLRGIPAH